jgi:Zn-dependent M28 family amino/carboxypeptidase
MSWTRIFKAVVILLIILWFPTFWYLRNPVFTKAEITTGHTRIDPKMLEAHVRFLTGLTPNRSYEHVESLEDAQRYIEKQFQMMGYTTRLQKVEGAGRAYNNVIARYGDENAKEILVVGAHFDVATTSNPGADDNASGIAGLLELARAIKTERRQFKYPVEFVAYNLEEPPFFGTKEMGSAYHADELKEKGVNVVLMLSLEMIGYYSGDFLSQKFSIPLLYAFYPWIGNFIGVVGVPEDRDIQKRFKLAMDANSSVPVISITSPPIVPGIDYSDHRNYWAHDWPAFMITDTAFLRNDQYHEKGDTSDRLNYEKMAEVARGVFGGLLELAK